MKKPANHFFITITILILCLRAKVDDFDTGFFDYISELVL